MLDRNSVAAAVDTFIDALAAAVARKLLDEQRQVQAQNPMLTKLLEVGYSRSRTLPTLQSSINE
jgi:hypothetical protein